MTAQQLTSNIVVIGSVNIDINMHTPYFVKPHQTILSSDMTFHYGGKGANQAVGVRKLGLEVDLVASVGSDSLRSPDYLKYLNNLKINTSFISQKNAEIGTALIEVTSEGDNRIILFEGANAHLSTKDIDLYIDAVKNNNIKEPNIKGPKIALLQMEVPISVIEYAVKELKKYNYIIILDPAPAKSLSEIKEILNHVDYITPNHNELITLLGQNINEDPLSIQVAVNNHLHQYKNLNIITTMGNKGSLLINLSNNKMHHAKPKFTPNVVDTVAAGDSFNAGLCYGIFNKYSIEDAMHIANAAGAFATEKSGTHEAMCSDINTILNLL